MSDKVKKIYYTVGEAAKDIGIYGSKIRYWDDEYNVIKDRTKGNLRKITVKELMLLHKIHTLTKFMNSTGVKAVLEGDIQLKVNPEIL